MYRTDWNAEAERFYAAARAEPNPAIARRLRIQAEAAGNVAEWSRARKRGIAPPGTHTWDGGVLMARL